MSGISEGPVLVEIRFLVTGWSKRGEASSIFIVILHMKRIEIIIWPQNSFCNINSNSLGPHIISNAVFLKIMEVNLPVWRSFSNILLLFWQFRVESCHFQLLYSLPNSLPHG
jgi:hypothetical protein